MYIYIYLACMCVCVCVCVGMRNAITVFTVHSTRVCVLI